MTLEKRLEEWMRDYGRLVILGIGNPLRKDDAVGVEIVRALKGRVPKKVRLIECQTTPENFAGRIKRLKPSHILMIDAAHFSAKAGEVRLFPPEKISGVALSTHAMPLHMLVEVLQSNLEVKVALLGVEPKSVEFGEGLTPETQKAVARIAETLEKILRCE